MTQGLGNLGNSKGPLEPSRPRGRARQVEEGKLICAKPPAALLRWSNLQGGLVHLGDHRCRVGVGVSHLGPLTLHEGLFNPGLDISTQEAQRATALLGSTVQYTTSHRA